MCCLSLPLSSFARSLRRTSTASGTALLLWTMHNTKEIISQHDFVRFTRPILIQTNCTKQQARPRAPISPPSQFTSSSIILSHRRWSSAIKLDSDWRNAKTSFSNWSSRELSFCPLTSSELIMASSEPIMAKKRRARAREKTTNYPRGRRGGAVVWSVWYNKLFSCPPRAGGGRRRRRAETLAVNTQRVVSGNERCFQRRAGRCAIGKDTCDVLRGSFLATRLSLSSSSDDVNVVVPAVRRPLARQRGCS